MWFKEGASFTRETYDNKGKVTGIIKQKVLNVESEGNSVKASVNSELYDKNNELQSKSEYTMKCEEGSFYIDMKAFLAPENMKAFKNMEVTGKGDFLVFPAEMEAGATLPDGTLQMNIKNNGSDFAEVQMIITNRKVDAVEKINTPAGDFVCYKIRYDYEMIMKTLGIPLTFKGMATDWYNNSVGSVRSESYNKKGKMTSYSMLTSVGEPMKSSK